MRQLDIVKVETSEQDSSLSSPSDELCKCKKSGHQFLDKVINQTHVETLPCLPITWKCNQFYEFILIWISIKMYTHIFKTNTLVWKQERKYISKQGPKFCGSTVWLRQWGKSFWNYSHRFKMRYGVEQQESGIQQVLLFTNWNWEYPQGTFLDHGQCKKPATDLKKK